MRKAVSRESIEGGPLSVWRYADLLPCDADNAVDIEAGFTPLLQADRPGEGAARVGPVAATTAREFGFQTLACASTGNLANSVAAHAARAGLEAIVFIPSDLGQGKIAG